MAADMINFPILSALVFIPVIGALILLFVPGKYKDAIRSMALGITLLNCLVSIILVFNFDASTYKMQFIEKAGWMPGIGVEYFLGIDGISLLLVLLTAFIGVIGVACSWSAVEERVKEYMIHILVLETAMIGVFASLDMILFFLFWEIGLVPIYFLIGIWGGQRRLYANIKLFLYTLFGSVFMFVGIIALYYAHGSMTGEYTFNLLKLYEVSYPYNLQWWVFVAFFLGFAIKVPMFPFHTWLPDAHVEAPTAGSVILAGVLLKMGTYALLRFNLPLLPDASAAFTPFMLALSVIGIVYGAFLAIAQSDMKKLVAYSSVSHLGFVTAGIFVMNQQGIDGGLLQMINHGISTGGLFLIVGMIYERRHTREMHEFGGLSKVMPIYAFFTIVIALSSIALPGTNGFIGELLIFMGLFKYGILPAAIAVIGVVLGPIYILGMCKKVLLGGVTNPENEGLKDLNAREILTLTPIVILILWIGLYPKTFLGLTSASTTHLVEMVRSKQTAAHDQVAAHPAAIEAPEARGVTAQASHGEN